MSYFYSSFLSLFLKKLSRLSGKPGVPYEFKKMLVIQLNQLGDTIVFSPAIRSLRKSFPSSIIDVLVNGITEEIYRYCPYVDHLIYLNTNRLFSVSSLKSFQFLRKIKYDCSVLCASQLGVRSGLISWLTGARLRAGLNYEGRGFLNTNSLNALDVAIIEKNLQIIELLGAKRDGVNTEFWYKYVHSRQVNQILKKHGVDEDVPIICFSPFSKSLANEWPDQRWGVLANETFHKFRTKIVFVGTNKHWRRAAKIVSVCERNTAINLAGQTTIHELGALLARSILCVSVDSGTMHIANNFGVPLIILAGGRNYLYEWLPKASPRISIVHKEVPCQNCKRNVCPYRDHPCMSLISVDNILDAMEHIWTDTGTINFSTNRIGDYG